MQIIFGRTQAEALSERYTMIELDTFRFVPINTQSTAFCVLQELPKGDVAKLEQNLQLHNTALAHYRGRHWSDALEAIDQLTDYWGADIDTFYNDLKSRIAKYIQQDPGETWDGIVEKTVNIVK
jgi:hypothetical protein